MIRKFKRLWHYVLYFLSKVIGFFIPIRERRILLWSYEGKQFSCNPAYITKYILEKYKGQYEIIWMFTKDKDVSRIPKDIKIVRYGTLRHLVALNSAKFVITNSRTDYVWSLWHKKKGQKYVMTWHSSMGLKKIELDANWNYPEYIAGAKKDSARCDLIFSGSKFRTEVIKRAFQYDGEILESGTPRNDIFFSSEKFVEIRKKIFVTFSIPVGKKIVLYAPTFRKNNNLNYYKFDWGSVKKTLAQIFGYDFMLLVRLHPHMIDRELGNTVLFDDIDVINATYYDDMQELLVASDVLITDYSSSIFDFALSKKPCFLYANDTKEYERGTYFELSTLPFPFASNSNQLVDNIRCFNYESYLSSLNHFNLDVIGSYENGHASESFCKWMNKQ